VFFIRKYILVPPGPIRVDTMDILPPEWFPIEEDWLKRNI